MYFFKRSGLRASNQRVPVTRVYVNGDVLEDGRLSSQQPGLQAQAEPPTWREDSLAEPDSSALSDSGTYTPMSPGDEPSETVNLDGSWINDDVTLNPDQSEPVPQVSNHSGSGSTESLPVAIAPAVEVEDQNANHLNSDARPDGVSADGVFVQEPDGLFDTNPPMPGAPRVSVWQRGSQRPAGTGQPEFVTEQYRSTTRTDVRFRNGDRTHPRVSGLKVFGVETN